MTNYDYVQQTIDLFEKSLIEKSVFTTVKNLALRIGYCPHHLSRLFASLCGEPLGQYMQKRRLSEAARLMMDTSESAAASAIAYGWDDYSAFAKVFRKEFGIAPGSLKKQNTSPGLKLTSRARPVLNSKENENSLMPILVRQENFHVTGLVFFMNPNEKSFHKPWRIYSRNVQKIKGAKTGTTYQFSAWSDDNADEDEGLWIHCAVETDKSITQPPIFFSRDIPACNLLVFEHAGTVEMIWQTYHYIWNEYLPKSTYKPADNFEFQRYSDDGTKMQICIPVES